MPRLLQRVLHHARLRPPVRAIPALVLLLLAPAHALAAQPTGTATTQTVTTPATAKLGKPTTITPAPTHTTPSTTATSTTAAPASNSPATTAPTTGTPAHGAPAGGTPAASTPAGSSPATTVPTTSTSTPATSVLPGSGGATLTIEKGRPARARAGARGQSKKKISTEAIVLAVLAALAILACCVWALARSRAFEPHWLLSFRHAMTEAGYRMSGTWAEFQDWVRYGR